MNLFEVYLKQNCFELNNKIYTDSNSLAMGNPLRPLWYRYVDDIFSCFIGKKRQLDSAVRPINKLDSIFDARCCAANAER